MNFSKYIVLILTIVLCQSQGFAKYDSKKIGTSFKLSNSLILIPYRPVSIDHETELGTRGDLIESVFGFSFDLLYRAQKKTYLNLTLEYNILSFYKEELVHLTGEDLSVNLLSLQLGGVHFLNSKGKLTPYYGYALDLLLFKTNQSKVFEYSYYYRERRAVEFYEGVGIALLLKAGLTYQIKDNISLLAEFDLRVSSSDYLGALSKIHVGATYWIE